MSKQRVTTGMRTAGSSEPQVADDLVKPRPLRFTEASEPFPTRFQSKTQYLIITLNIPQQLPDGMMKDNKFNVTFEGGFVDITKKGYPFAPRIVSEKLQKLSGYGLGKKFWDAEAFAAQADASATDAFLAQAKALAADPEKRAALKAILADDFVLPNLPPADPSAE
ncbi:MAG TPA: hypothetical protein VMZ92_17425 [Planctomycetota bacterium]|nr:hypothetical protein [Planctomycetota bacterium]